MMYLSRNTSFLVLFSLMLSLIACQNNPSPDLTDPQSTSSANDQGPTRFRLVPNEQSGVQFSNDVNETYTYNILNYEYLCNGGGVAIGDINNDGLPDLYFTGTFVSNKLYLNKGNLQFEDITDKAGVGAQQGFKTGVSMVDINHDGWLDIYVCRTSKSDDGQKNNLLYVNQGDMTFKESAASYGLLDNSNTNHANFFDYDLDGDLDLYLLNHRLNFKEAVRMRLQQLPDGNIIRQTDPLSPFESDRLYRNEGNGSFTDVTETAGLVNSSFAFCATVSDLNGDNYPDVYVTNDYIEPDYVYINNGDGTFTDRYFEYLHHSSQNSMGCDIADYNNDGLVDIVVLDMITEDPFRYKELMNVMQLERYNALVQYGYGHQAGRNMLQLNNGNGTFSEIGQLAGVAATDWSWGALFADFDNDGQKDLYIANGYKHDVTDLDYMTYTRDSIEQTGGVNPTRFPDINDFLKVIPSIPQRNYLYHNQGDLTFDDVSESWGMPETSFSNGTAYGDLDGDGDIDLVVNNIHDPAFVYENLSQDIPGSHFLQVKLKGPEKNPLGVGASVKLNYDGQIQYLEMSPTRGFFSSSQHLLHFGLGEKTDGVNLTVVWADGKEEYLQNVKVDQVLSLDYQNAKKVEKPMVKKAAPLFAEATQALGIDFTHQENEFEDFNRERLLPHQLSKFGPRIAVADVDGDGLEDFFVGGALNESPALYIQNKQSRFRKASSRVLEADKKYEDIDALFFDADADGDQDLYVVSGGAAAQPGSPIFQDRLYLNDGNGHFDRSPNLPNIRSSGGCVSALDYDSDGDLDLFVGGRLTPGSYPSAPQSHLLQNDGGKFSDVTAQKAPSLQQAGMLSDLLWTDLDGDQKSELVVVGEWLPLSVYRYDGNQMVEVTADYGLQGTEGWWNCVMAQDIDGDGDQDLVAGNLGENTRLKAPLALFAKDFDNNKQIDPILAFNHQGQFYPFAGRDALAKQIPKIKKKFPRYAGYARATVEQVFSPAELADAQQFRANELRSCYFENDGQGKFKSQPLPIAAQVSPVTELVSDDFDGDGRSDLLLVGNSSTAERETGVYDAGNGVLLLGEADGPGRFSPNLEHGLWANGEVRDIERIQLADGRRALLIANNNGPLQALVYEAK